MVARRFASPLRGKPREKIDGLE